MAQVNEVNIELSPRGKVINHGRNLVLEGKQSLKIALLKIKFLTPGVDYKKNSVVLLSRDIFFENNESFKGLSGQERITLHKSLMPELFQIYSALREMKMTLVVSCSTKKECTPSSLREWIPKNISVVGIGPDKKYKLAKFKPVLILSNSRSLLENVEKYHPMRDSTFWSAKWIKLPQLSSVQLSYNEWSSLIPTVRKF